MKRIIGYSFLVIAGIMVSGCAHNDGPGVFGDVDSALKACNTQKDESLKSGYGARIRKIVGTRQDDARVVIDTGKVLKIWVAPYTQVKTLVAGHDVYTMVEQPRFIVGEMVPKPGRSRKGQYSCNAMHPFSIKEKYIETVHSPKKRRSGSTLKEKKQHYIK